MGLEIERNQNKVESNNVKFLLSQLITARCVNNINEMQNYYFILYNLSLEWNDYLTQKEEEWFKVGFEKFNYYYNITLKTWNKRGKLTITFNNALEILTIIDKTLLTLSKKNDFYRIKKKEMMKKWKMQN